MHLLLPCLLALAQAANFPVKLVLLQPLESGAPAGTRVAFVVAQDVKDASGKVLVQAGTPAYGHLVESRRARALSKLENKPARLAVQLDRTFGTAKQTIDLESESGDPVIQLNRANTTEMAKQLKLEEAWRDPSERRMLEHLVSQFQAQKPINLSPQEQQMLQQQSATLSLTDTAQLCKQGQLSSLARFMQAAKSGQGFLIPTGTQAEVLCGCVLEMADLCRRSQGYLDGRFRGANIVAEPGTVISALAKG